MAAPSPRPSRAVYIRRRIVAGVLALGLVGGVAVATASVVSDDEDAVDPAAATTTVVAPADTTTTSGTASAPAQSTTATSTTVVVSTVADTPAPTDDTTTPTDAADTSSTQVVDAIATDPSAPVVNAAAYGVYDLTAQTWLTGTNADVSRPVGSIMKLLTAYVVMQAGDPAKVVTVPALTIDPKESAIGLYAGEQLPRDVLLRAMLIVSANDAAEALALDVGGTRDGFVAMMNDAARELGLDGTRASNPSGLDGGGAGSTVRDIVTLSVELMEDPDFRAAVAKPSARLHGQTFPSTNELLGAYPGADGIKTGSTTQAGYGVVASATRNGRTIVVVVLGSATDASRFLEAAALLDWAFAREA